MENPDKTDRLQFPDWTGMDDSAKRITLETAFRLTEEYLLIFPEALKNRERKDCAVEFVL